MSRIGKRPVDLPSGVEAQLSGQTLSVKGPKGTRTFTATDDVTLAVGDGAVTVTPRGTSKRARQQWGMSRTMVQNLVTGVTAGFRKELEIQGVGYRATMQGDVLKLALGYSHDVNVAVRIERFRWMAPPRAECLDVRPLRHAIRRPLGVLDTRHLGQVPLSGIRPDLQAGDRRGIRAHVSLHHPTRFSFPVRFA